MQRTARIALREGFRQRQGRCHPNARHKGRYGTILILVRQASLAAGRTQAQQIPDLKLAPGPV